MANLETCPHCGGRIGTGIEAGVCPQCGHNLVVETPMTEPDGGADSAGQTPRFGVFLLGDFLGEGPTGTVWRAVHEPSGKSVALKILRSTDLITHTTKMRFLDQVARASRLNEPHVARLLESGELEGQVYVAYEFIEGAPVTVWASTLADGSPPRTVASESEAARQRQGGIAVLFAKVARTLHAAHLAGVLHLNLKPSNIVVDTNDEPQLLDFCLSPLRRPLRPGEAAIVDEASSYEAPEQAAGQPGSAVTDVYSLGIILAEALAGRRPPLELRDEELDLIEVDLAGAGVAPPLCRVVRRALHPRAANRLPSALAMAEALEDAATTLLCPLPLGEEPSLVSAAGPKSQVRFGFAALGVLLALGLAFLMRTEKPELTEPTNPPTWTGSSVADLQRAQEAESTGNIASALCHYARALRLNPRLSNAATSLVSLLTTHDHPLPRVHLDKVATAVFSGNGRILAIARPAGHIEARNWPLDEAPSLRIPPSRPVRSLRLDHEGHWLALVLNDESLAVWSLGTDARQTLVLPPGAAVLTLAFHPTSSSLMAVRADGAIGCWPLASGQSSTQHLEVQTPLRDADFSSDYHRLLVVEVDGQVSVLETTSGRRIETGLPPLPKANRACFGPAGRQIITSDESGVWLWSPTAGPQGVQLAPAGETLAANPFSPEAERILTVVASTEEVLVRRLHAPLAASPSLRHRAGVRQVEFHPDGQQVLTVDGLAHARIWDVRPGTLDAVQRLAVHPLEPASFPTTSPGAIPPFAPEDLAGGLNLTGPAPSWLPLLAEAVAGWRLETWAELTSAPSVEFADLQNRLGSPGEADPWAAWAGWFVADRSTRPVAPGSSQTVSEWLRPLNAAPTQASLRRALLWTPNDANLSASLALMVAADPDATPDVSAEAAWHAQRAQALASHDANVLLAAHVWSERQSSVPNSPGPPHPDLQAASRSPAHWINEGHTCWQSNRWPEAALAYTRAIELLDREGKTAAAQARLFRSAIFRLLELHAEAGQDNCLARGIPVRPATTPRQLVDLSAHYNAALSPNWHNDRPGNDLAELPTGTVKLAGVDFDVRGLIQLQALAGPATQYPIQITNILLHQSCQRLHFLHAATHSKDTPPTEIGSYRLHYASGDHRDLVVVLGDQVRDWWNVPNPPPLSPDTVVGWVGANATSRPLGATISLFQTTWDNPLPDQTITSIDLRSAQSGPGLLVVAITLE